MTSTKKLANRLQNESFHIRHEMERFTAEVDFAEKLMELLPGKKTSWGKIVAEAVGLVEGLPELNNAGKLKAAVRQAEKIMAPIAEHAKKYTVHCVGHAHIDMNWKWGWPETVATVNDTFATVLKLMDEFPEFVFSQSQASIYAIVEKYNPEMLEKIKARVREGRWEVTASHWVENEKNIVGGESLSRHLLYTRRYMEKLFGLKPEDVVIDWAPDTFGHAATVPTYLARGGIKYCYMMRPGEMAGRRPTAFRWKGPDGSEILVKNDMAWGYSARIIAVDLSKGLVDFVRLSGGHNHMFLYGIGDHGGGPTRCDLKRIEDISAWPVFPVVKFATARSAFEALERDSGKLPVIEDELNSEFTGCYTSQSIIKKAVDYSERRLIDAEYAALMAWKLKGMEYPRAKLEQSWKDCLFNHFHDILPGSGVRDTRHYSMGLFQNIITESSMIETLALRRIASAIDTSGDRKGQKAARALPPAFYMDAFGAGVGVGAIGGNMSSAEQSAGQGDRPFVIFNPQASDRNEVVEVTLWDNPIGGDMTPLKNRPYSVIAPEGKTLPAQFIGEGYVYGHRFIKLAFPVKIAAFGYSVYTVTEAATENYPSALKLLQAPYHCTYSSWERAARFGCENASVLLELNPKTGGILRLRDKKSGRDIIGPKNQVPVLEYSNERPRTMSSWLIDLAGKKEAVDVKSISYATIGPHKIEIKVEAAVRDSRFTVVYELQAESPLVSIHIKGNWLETGNAEKGCPALRMPFAFNLDSAAASYEIPFGSIQRKLNSDEEVPALQWAKVRGGQGKKTAGCLVLNDCKHGYALDGNTLRVSLIRSSYEPDLTPELGEHEIHLGLFPFAGNLSSADAAKCAGKFNHRPKVTGTDIHAGTLPAAMRLIKLSAANVMVSGFKKAEDNNAVIVRLYETEGKAANLEISLDKILGTIKGACLVDFMERPVPGASKPAVKSNAVRFDVPAYGISTLRIDFGK